MKIFKKSEAKLLGLGLGFIILLQLTGSISACLNSARLNSFQPWLPNYPNASVPLLARWDSGWYVAVAEWGYYLKTGLNSTVVFFPLFPLLIKALSLALPFNFFYLGQIISWTALFAALVFFYRLMRLDYDEKRSLAALFYLLVFPWSFFLAAVYTESLFLFFAIAAFYFARRRNWPVASLFGLLSGLTRITGVFLLPALTYEFLVQNRKLTTNSAWLMFIPAGLFGFMLYLKFQVGSFFAFVQNQSSFGRHAVFPLNTLWRDYKNILTFYATNQPLKGTVYALGLLAVLVATWLLIQKRRELRGSYQIFSWLSLLLPLCTGTTTSIGRYLLSIFPVFIAVSLTENRLFKLLWILLGVMFLLVLTFAFTAWYFVV